MEKKTTIEEAKKIMGKNFIGSDELLKISQRFGIFTPPKKIPAIPFSGDFLRKNRKDYILILGLPGLTINKMRKTFGFDPEKFEPCFYNQDWYLKENFALKEALSLKWYLISKKIGEKTKGKDPENLKKSLRQKEDFPSAVLAAFAFFAYYFLTKEILWRNDFIWCSDKDSNGDRIYAGRYEDPKGLNKNGFNIHRHLSIRRCYGLAIEII